MQTATKQAVSVRRLAPRTGVDLFKGHEPGQDPGLLPSEDPECKAAAGRHSQETEHGLMAWLIESVAAQDAGTGPG